MSSFIINSSNLAMEPPELALDGSWGLLHSFKSDPHPLGIEIADATVEQEVEDQSNILPGNKDIVIDTNSEFYKLYIESEEDKNDPSKENKIRDMEKSISKTCRKLGNSLEAYYQRISKAYNSILKSRFSKGYYSLRPSINFHDYSKQMREIALAPWRIRELPGRSPLTQWPESLDELNRRLDQLEPMSGWVEPIFNKEEKNFYEQAEEFIQNLVVKKKKMVENGLNPEKGAKIDKTLCSAISALIGYTIQSADYSKILSLLYTIYQISENYPEADGIIEGVQKAMVRYVNELKSIHEQTESYHHLAQGSIYGSILLPKEASAEYVGEGSSSLTTDGCYLYIYWCSGAGMFKIGTGEGGSIAGKVYNHCKTDMTDAISWVYLKNKLYAREVQQTLGVLTVISPETFQVEGNIYLQCNDSNILSNPMTMRYNKKYPLLTDGNNLYIILMSIASQERILREGAAEEIQKMVEEEQERKNKEKSKDNENSEQNKDDSAKAPSKKGDMIFSKFPVNGDGNNSASPQDGDFKLSVDNLKEAKLCEFYLLGYTVDTDNKEVEKQQLCTDDPDVHELYQSFSCFFTLDECARALKINNQDIAEAAAWLTEEGNNDMKNTLIANSKVLLAQSEIQNDRSNSRNTSDIQVRDDSLLFPHDVVDLYWTMNDGQLTLNKYFRNEVNTKVFSTSEEDLKEIESEEVLSSSKRPAKLKKRPKTSKRNFFNHTGAKEGLFDSSDDDLDVKSPHLVRASKEVTGERPHSNSQDVAMQMYKKVPLKGTYIKSIKDVRLLDYDMALSYDHTYNKFYGLVSSQSNKVVLVAQDMTRLRKAVFDHDQPMEKLEITPNEPGVSSPEHILKHFLNKVIEFFMKFEKIRADVPWRWRRWLTVFSSAIDSSVVKDAKISKRYEKIRDYELNQYRIKFGLENKAISSKGKKDKKQKPPIQSTISSSSYYTGLTGSTPAKAPTNEHSKEVPIRIEETKLQAYCISGDIDSLRILFKYLQACSITKFIDKEISDAPEINIFKNTLKQLTYWTRVSDTLASSPIEGDPQLLTEIGHFLMEFIKTDHGDNSSQSIEEARRLAWVAMINGFELFYRSAETQFDFIKTLFNDGIKYKKLITDGKDVPQHTYYEDSINYRLPPVLLFFITQFKPQTFIFKAPLVCSEVKEYSVKFKLKNKEKPTEGRAYVSKFMQKQQQLFQLFNMGGILECGLNEVLEQYKQIEEQKHSNLLSIESIQEVQTFSSTNPKEFCNPFTMLFLLDQKIDFTEDLNEAMEEVKSNIKEESKIDDEAEQIEDYVTELYLNLYQEKSIESILDSNGYHPEKYIPKPSPKSKGKGSKRSNKEEHSKRENNRISEERKVQQANLVQKRKILREVHQRERELHQDRVKELWDLLTQTLLDLLSDAREYSTSLQNASGPSELKKTHSLSMIRYVWRIFNRLVEDSLAIKYATFHNTEKNREFIYTCIKFAETAVLQVAKVKLSELNNYEWKWIRCLNKYFNILLLQSIDDLKVFEFAKKVLPCFFNVSNMLHTLIGISEKRLEVLDENQNQENSNTANPGDLSGNMFNIVGGVDYTNEKIFETPHPYPRGDFSIKESFSFPKAVAVLVRFDQRCQSDSNMCSIIVSSNDTSFWFNDNFGTSYRSSSKPNGQYSYIYMLGNRVTIEFRSSSQGGRKMHDLQGDESIDRYGFRIAVNAIYSESIPNSTENIQNTLSKKMKLAKPWIKEIKSWFSLLNSLTHSCAVMSQTLIKGTERDNSSNSVVTWNLLRGGILPGSLDKDSHNPIVEYLKEIENEQGNAYKVCQKIRELAPKHEVAPHRSLKAKFSPETLKKWDHMINLCMISLMYHSDIIEDAFEYVLGMDKDDPDAPKYEEKLRIVWSYTFKIVKWAQGSVFKYPNLKNLLVESIEIARDALETQKRKIHEEWEQKQKDKIKEEKEKQKKLEEEKKKEEAKKDKAKVNKNIKSSSTMKVASSQRGIRGKRFNRRKLVNQIDVSKTKKNKKKEESKKHEDFKEEDSKEGATPPENQEKPPEITDDELAALCSQIYTDICSHIIKLQDEQLLKSLCQRFAIPLDETNIKPALKQICRIIIKDKLKPVVDLKKPTELRNNDFDPSRLESPEVSVMNEVREKVMFLLELNPSIGLNSQILESSGDDQTLTRLKSSQEMNLLHSSDSYSGFGNQSDSDVSLQRSKSAVINPSNKNEFLKTKSKKLSRRGMVKKHNLGHKHGDASNSVEGASSFKSVVSFITDPNIKNFKSIRESIDAHYVTADNRLQGLDYLNKLLKSIRITGQSKSLSASLAGSISQNPFVNIEASGVERLRKTNNKLKEILTSLIYIFISDYSKLKKTVAGFINARPKANSKMPLKSSSDEVIVIHQIRGLLESLNDMIIILSDNPAKDAFILHIVLEFSKGDLKFSEFFKNLIGLILDTKDSLILFNKSHLSEELISKVQTAAKLLLGKFIIYNTEDSQISLDAHSLLQHTLLENLIGILKQEITPESSEGDCLENSSIHKFLTTRYQRLVTLFLMISDALKMSYSQENINEDIKKGILEMVGHCINPNIMSFEQGDISDLLMQEERSNSTRVIRAACQVAALCIDKESPEIYKTFIASLFRKIGQCLTVSDQRAQVALEHYINPIEKRKDSSKKIEEEKKSGPEQEKDSKELNDPAISKSISPKEDHYFVYATLNNSTDDCSFLVTALFELDKQWNLSQSENKEIKVKSPVKKRSKTPDKQKAKESKIITSKSGLDRLIKFAKEIQNCLKTKGTTKIAVKTKMSLLEARKVAEIFYKAYDGEIPPLLINDETLNHLRHSKYLGGIDIQQSYPGLFERGQDNSQAPPRQPGIGPLIKLSQDTLKMTICKATPGFSVKIDGNSKKIINQRKFCIDNNSRKLVRTGYSSGLIIQDLKKLIREILSGDGDHNLVQNRSMISEIKKVLEVALNRVISLSENSQLVDSQDDLNLMYGALEVVADLFHIVQPGSEVSFYLNDKLCQGTVVDGSYYSGRLDLSVILEDEESIIKIPRNEAKLSGMFEKRGKIVWAQQLLPDISLVNKAIICCFKSAQKGNSISECNGANSNSLILTMLLRISLLYKEEAQNENLETMETLLKILDEYNSKAVEIPTEESELELTETWRRIVDKLEPVLNYHYTVEPSSDRGKQSEVASIKHTDITVNEFAMPRSGYDQLPRPIIPANEKKAAIRLLAYWEKNIIPKIIDFVKSTYKPWEMEFYFEQLRHNLRIGDQAKALEDAMIMLEKKMPAGAVVPDDSYDWSAKMPEECIIGSWFLVKVPELKATFGREEIVVMLKAIDFENKIAFVEYIDTDSMRYNMWVPLRYDPPVPLNTPAVCSTIKTLREQYESKIMTVNAYYAKKIITSHFMKKGAIAKVVTSSSDDLVRVKQILTWIISNEFEHSYITGVLDAFQGTNNCSITKKLSKYNENELKKSDLGELTRVCAASLEIKDENLDPGSTYKRFIQNELEKSINKGQFNVVEHLQKWIIEKWEVLAQNIKSQKVDIDICKEYQSYAGIGERKENYTGDQEIIECGDGTALLPLHELFDEEARKRLNTGMIISFDRNLYFLCKTATLKFYSDERGANLIAELNQNSNQGTQIRPLVFNYGKVWCVFEAGSSVILPLHMQKDVTTSLKCSISLIPHEWTTCAVMTGNICNSLMKSHKPEHEEFEGKIFGGLIQQLTKFYRTASGPPSLNILVLKILNTIIQDYRSIKLTYESNFVSQDEDDYESVISGHFDRIHVTKAFVQEVVSEANIIKPSQSDLTGAKTLFSEYLQTQVELIVGTLLPTARGEKIKALSDLIDLPKWLENVGVAAQILAHLDSPKNLLFSSIEQECFDQTRLSSQWGRVVIISKLPIDMKRSEIESKILSAAKDHRVIVKDIYIPHGDISSPKSETKKAIQDLQAAYNKAEDAHQTVIKEIGIKIQELQKKKKEENKNKDKKPKATPKKNTKSAKEPEAKKDKQESQQDTEEKKVIGVKEEQKISEVEEEKKSAEETNWEEYDHQGAAIVLLDEFDLELLVEADQIQDQEEVEQEEEKKEPEPAAALAIYNCIACTLENPMSNETCSMCGTPRPPNDGQEEKKEEADQAEEEDITKEFEDSYDLAIRNRIKYFTNDIKEIVVKMNRDDETLAESRQQEIDNLQKKLEGTNMLTKKQVEEVKESLQDVENMSLGRLFGEAEGDEEKPKEGDKKEEEKKKNNEEDAKQEQKQEDKEEDDKDDKKEDTKEDKKEGSKEENKKEQREDIKIFFGDNIDDDYKSEVYLNDYLKKLLLNDDKTLTDNCKRIQKEILENKDNTEFGIEISMILTEKDLVNLIDNDPRKAWEIFEGQGYDLGSELSAYRTPEEYSQLFTISDTEEDPDRNIISTSDLKRLLRLIAVDICGNSIISPHFRGNGLKTHSSKYHAYQIDREVVQTNYPGLLDRVTFREIRYFWALTRILNKYLHESIYLTYCSETQASTSGQKEVFTLSGLISKFRIVIHSIKFYLKQTVLDRTSVDRDKPPELVFERLKIAHFQQERDTEAIEIETLSADEEDDQSISVDEEEGESFTSLLYTSYEQMAQADVALLRAKRPQGAEPHLSFTVLFKGEFVVGEGGPYRQFFADLSSEIQPANFVPGEKGDMPILVPTPNNKSEVKDYKEYWTINPSCVSTQDLALYEYLGVLMGVCIRTNVHLTLNLPSIFWKPLVGESLTLMDIHECDIGFLSKLNYIIETPKEGFEDIIMETFSLALSDESVVELKPNGLEEPVTFDNKNEFIIKAISAKLQESSLQIHAVKKGLTKIIPEGLLNLMTPEELRESVCGKIECDLELLKRNTEYGGTNPRELENSDCVKWLWEVLEEISEEDRLKFIVFCWGQERLPANDEEFKLSKTRFMIKPSINQSYGDGALPRANTCFFNFELPKYSSKEVLRERLLLAIRTDNKSMNAEQQEFMEHQSRNDMFSHRHHHDDDY